MPWLDRFKRQLGPGHLRKGKVIETTFFEGSGWPFVTLEKQGPRSWLIRVYNRPGPPFPGAPLFTLALSMMSLKDALQRASDENRLQAERYMRRRRKKQREDHDRVAQQEGSRHQLGPIDKCPTCRAAKRGRK